MKNILWNCKSSQPLRSAPRRGREATRASSLEECCCKGDNFKDKSWGMVVFFWNLGPSVSPPWNECGQRMLHWGLCVGVRCVSPNAWSKTCPAVQMVAGRAAFWAAPPKPIPAPSKHVLWQLGRMVQLLAFAALPGKEKHLWSWPVGKPPEREARKRNAIPLQGFIIDLKSREAINVEPRGIASKQGWIFNLITAKTKKRDPVEIAFWMNESPPAAFASAAGFQTDFFFFFLLKMPNCWKQNSLWKCVDCEETSFSQKEKGRKWSKHQNACA